MSWGHVRWRQCHSPATSAPPRGPGLLSQGSWVVGWYSTSSTRLGAGGPALKCPLIRVRLLQKHIVAPDKWQQVLMDDVLIGQAAGGTTLFWGEHLRGDRGSGTGLENKEVRPGEGGEGRRGISAQHSLGSSFRPATMQQTQAEHLLCSRPKNSLGAHQ